MGVSDQAPSLHCHCVDGRVEFVEILRDERPLAERVSVLTSFALSDAVSTKI